MSNAPWDVLEEHLERAGELIEQWHAVQDAASFTVDELQSVYEHRLFAHLDALDVGGAPVMQRLLEPALVDPECAPAKAAAVALALFASPTRTHAPALLERLPSLPEPVRIGVLQALAICERHDLGRAIGQALAAGDPPLQAGLVEVVAVRGEDVQGAMDSLLLSEDPAIRGAALRAARWGDRRLQPWIERALQSPDATVRDAALPAGLVMGSEHAWQLTNDLAASKEPVHREAMTAVAMLGDLPSVGKLAARTTHAASRADVLWALGFSGRVIAADACLPWLGDDAVGPLAGEAFAAITGIDTTDRTCWKLAEPEPPTDDDALPAPAPPAPRELPVPIAAGITRWWTEHRKRFAPDRRYILGRPADQSSLADALRHESLRRRHLRAFELLVRTRGLLRVHTRMLAQQQLRELASAGGWPRIDLDRPFARIG